METHAPGNGAIQVRDLAELPAVGRLTASIPPNQMGHDGCVAAPPPESVPVKIRRHMGRLPGGAAGAGELVRVRRGEKAAVRFRPVPHPGNGESIKKGENDMEYIEKIEQAQKGLEGSHE